MVTTMMMQPVATMFAGRLGQIQLGAVTFSNTLINIMGMSVIVGSSTGSDTFLSQAYGAGNKKMVGVYFQRSLLINLLYVSVTCAISLNIEPILLLIGQDPQIARLCGRYLTIFQPGFLCLFLSILLRKYLQIQGVLIPHMVISVVCLTVHALLQWTLVDLLDMGLDGSALAECLAYLAVLLCTFLYTVLSGKFKETWDGWSWLCLEEWGPIVKLSLFAMMAMCLEWWALELTNIFAGMAGTMELATQGLLFNLDVTFFGVASGMGHVASFRVGLLLGAGEAGAASLTARTSTLIMVCVGAIMSLMFGFLRGELPKIFTSDTEIIGYAAEILPIMAVHIFFNNINGIGRGIMRGCGKQGLAMLIIFAAHYFVSLPVGAPLLFLTPLRIKGIWIGICLGMIISACTYQFLVWIIFDWNKLSEQAQERVLQRCTDYKVPSEDIVSDQERQPLLSSVDHCSSNYESKEKTNSDEEQKLPDGTVKKSSIPRKLLLKRILITLPFLALYLVSLSWRIYREKSRDHVQINNEPPNNVTVMPNMEKELFIMIRPVFH